MLTLFLILCAAFFGAGSDAVKKYIPNSYFIVLGNAFEAWAFYRGLNAFFFCAGIVLYSPVTIPPVDLILYFGVYTMSFDICLTLFAKRVKA